MTAQKGKFITFEGGEGAGKTTQIQLLKDHLQSKGIDVITTREPGGTPGAEDVRDLLKNGDLSKWDGTAEALLLYAARHDHVEKIIKPALHKGTWVLCDRFSDSSLVYQGVARDLGIEKITQLHEWALGNFYPDLTFVFDIPPQKSRSRQQQRNQQADIPDDRFEQLAIDFHQKVYEGYISLTKLFPDRCVLIDATKNVHEVKEQIRNNI